MDKDITGRLWPNRIHYLGCQRLSHHNPQAHILMGHLVLLGDSILDNAAYVKGGDCIASQLYARLSRDWQITLLARDGAIAEAVTRQLSELPATATHLVVSAGGNDALECIPIINSPTPDSKSCLAELLEAVSEFSRSYSTMIAAIRRRQLPTIICTIYDSVPDLRPLERMALSLFNDIIVRQATAFRFPQSICAAFALKPETIHRSHRLNLQKSVGPR